MGGGGGEAGFGSPGESPNIVKGKQYTTFSSNGAIL